MGRRKSSAALVATLLAGALGAACSNPRGERVDVAQLLRRDARAETAAGGPDRSTGAAGPAAADQSGAPCRGDKDVRGQRVSAEVFGTRVADGHGGVAL